MRANSGFLSSAGRFPLPGAPFAPDSRWDHPAADLVAEHNLLTGFHLIN
jgi:hypothetical protein